MIKINYEIKKKERIEFQCESVSVNYNRCQERDEK